MKVPLKLALAGWVLSVGVIQAQESPPLMLPKSYGTGFQTLHVGAAAFRPIWNIDDFSFDMNFNGYIYNGSSLPDYLVAPVTLPAGGEIYALCLYAHDSRADANVEVVLEASRLIPGGLMPGVIDVSNPVTSNWDTGFGVVCADLASPYTYTEASTEDGVALAYHLLATVPPNMGVGGVKIIWRRQVSPPPASSTFGDVPTDHPFFQFIEALAPSGITAGCAPGNFCPNAPLTRGQMAVFLSKALGLHWPY